MADQLKKHENSKNKKQRVTVKSTRGRKEITAIVLAAIGIFLLFAIIGKAGVVGNFVRNVTFGLFGGFTTIVMLALLFAVAWCILRGTADRVFSFRKCVLFGALLLVVSALMHTFFFGMSDYKGLRFFTCISKLWSAHKGGGLIGGGLSLLLQKFVAKPGAFVILIPATLILSMVLFSLSLVNLAKWFSRCGKAISGWFGGVRERFRADAEQNPRSPENKIKTVPATECEIPGTPEAGEIEFVSAQSNRKRDFFPGEEEYNREESRNSAAIQPVPERNPLPETDAVLPTKIPDQQEEFHLVTGDDSLEYVKPPFSMLRSVEVSGAHFEEQQKKCSQTAKKLEEVMSSFGVEAKVIRALQGSTVTMYELQPQSGVKVSRIKSLADDIALNLAASGIRIEAPIPGKAAIGIEIPNEEKTTVYLKDLIETKEFINHKSKLAFCLGQDISGEPVISDIAKMPHMLIAGTTGSGKSVCINCLIVSLLYRCSPNDVRLIMIDPKVVELQMYNGIPHLLIPVVTEPKKAAAALSWAVQEMENRYKQFAKCNIRDITSYNIYAQEHGLPTLPRIVIIIDELADLMMVVRDSIEEAINRIAQKARAAGMHLIVATQRPSVDVITGLIKANIPSRIAFAVSSQVDSKTILDYSGAEKLLGRGDMLYCPVGCMKASRVQGGFVSDGEIEEVVEFLKASAGENSYDDAISEEIENVRLIEKPGKRGGNAASASGEAESFGDEEMLIRAVDIAIEMKQISASFLQRRLGLGYSRASRMIDQMEDRGFISVRDGNNPRQVLIQENPLRKK